MASSASEKLVSLVSHLGGRTISSREIDWVYDIPAGKQLLEWFVAPLDNWSEAGDDDEADHRHNVVLKDVALEPEELSS